jgi:hypothetical protein
LIRQMRRLINTMTSIDFSTLISPTLKAAEWRTKLPQTS